MRELSLNTLSPAILEYPSAAPAAICEPWRVLRVLTSRECDVERLLCDNGIEALVPQGKVLRRPHGQRAAVSVSRPLFPSYVFAHFADTDATPILQCTPFTLSVLRFGREDALIPQTEMDRVVTLAAQPEVESWPGLVVGKPVQVMIGPMAGLEGILTEIRGLSHVVVNVSMLGRSVGAVVDRELVMPL